MAAERISWLASLVGVYRIAGLAIATIIVLFVVIVGALLHRDTLQSARIGLDCLSIALVKQQGEVLKAAQLTVDRMADQVAILSGEPALRLLADQLRRGSALNAVLLVDSAGQTIASTDPKLHLDRAFLAAAIADSVSQTPVSGRPIYDQAGGRWSLPIARMLPLDPNWPHLALIGMLPLEALQEPLSPITASSDLTVTLQQEDGTVLARFPPLPPGRAAPMSELQSGHRLGTTTLWTVLSRPEPSVLATWRWQMIVISIFSAAVILCVLLLLRGLARQAKIQSRIRHTLSQRNQMLEEARAALERQTGTLEATAIALGCKEKLLADRSNILDTTLNYIDQGVMMVDANGTVVVYNQRVVEMLGLPEELLSSYPPFSAILRYQWESGEFTRTNASIAEFVRAGGIDGAPRVYERERPNGRVLEIWSMPLPGGGIVRTYADITDRKLDQVRIERAALIDELTGLPNRLSLRQELEQRLLDPLAGQEIGLLYLNIDRFRLLNDARGHGVGDLVLVEMARRLEAVAPPADMVCRTGGDEFAILHVFDSGADDTSALGQALLDRLSEPLDVGDLRLSVTVSVGVAIAPPGASTDSLLRNADIAMYRAKDTARNQLSRYDPAMTVAQQERFQMEQSLREAIGSSAFRLAYQPILSLETNTIAGYEALLRWTDHVRGEVSPADFIPIAEATGLIVPLGRQVLEWACFEAASWPDECTIAVNLSPAQFQDETLLDTIKDVLQRSRLAPSRLELEVTEGMLLENTQSVHNTMLALGEIGVSLTLDDFGTGHAGLSTLRRFPFEKIKIDRYFVSTLGIDRDSDAIVEAILLLGRRLGLRVVAEGVESMAQLAQLRRMQCPYVQGYMTGRPQIPGLARSGPTGDALEHERG